MSDNFNSLGAGTLLKQLADILSAEQEGVEIVITIANGKNVAVDRIVYLKEGLPCLATDDWSWRKTTSIAVFKFGEAETIINQINDKGNNNRSDLSGTRKGAHGN